MSAGLHPPQKVDGFVLAGGQSTRMGRDKALLKFDGITLVERALRSLRSVTEQPRIAGDRADLAGIAPVVDDIYFKAGPLGGIHAALSAAVNDWSIFLPVDLPLLPASFLRQLIDRVALTSALATMPISAGRPQPLVAVYHRSLLPGITGRLESGDFGTLRGIAAAVKATGQAGGVDLFSVESLVCSGQFSCAETDLPSNFWFQNMNTPSELDHRASDM